MADDLLRSFRDEGEWESQGSFTLDPGKVWQKLGQFALSDPRRYLLHLISWAVGCGASSVEISHERGLLRVVPHGIDVSAAHLPRMVSGETPDSPAWRDLLIATASASRLPGARVTLQAAGTRLLADADGLRLEARGVETEVSWQLEEEVSRLFDWVGRLLGDQTPEIALVRELCAYCEVPVLVGGEPIALPLRLPPIRKALHLAGPGLPVAPEQLATGDIETRPSPGPYSCLVLASTTEILPTRAIYIVRGVTFERPPLQLYGENFVALVNAPHLEKDLSGEGLVDNDDCRQVDAQIARLARELWESPT